MSRTDLDRGSQVQHESILIDFLEISDDTLPLIASNIARLALLTTSFLLTIYFILFNLSYCWQNVGKTVVLGVLSVVLEQNLLIYLIICRVSLKFWYHIN